MATITAASTLAFSLSPLEVALEHIAAYGFSKVELSDQVTHSQHYGVDSVDPLEVKGLLSRYALEPVAARKGDLVLKGHQPGDDAENRVGDLLRLVVSTREFQLV